MRSGDEQGVPLEIGIDGGYSHWSDTEIEARKELGAAVTRFEWEPVSDLEESEETVLAAAEIGTRLHALLGGNDLGDSIEYRDWVVEFIRYYGPNGTFWMEHPELDASNYAITTVELGNEPYVEGVSPAEYADAIRPALEAIDDLGLPVEVVVAADVYGADTSWVDGLYEHSPDLNSLVDAFALHPYWYGHPPYELGPASPFERIETLREAIDSHDGESIPIEITEYGQSTASCGEECVSEEDQAADLAAMIDAVTANSDWKVELLSIFQLIDRGTDTEDRELQFGLLREDGSPKPSYDVARDAMQTREMLGLASAG
ncbi:MAG TPA: hypothetical protein VFX45_07000 [Solirubrobacterales bacterium]|nr:hypothetical protein [Solirubrobacterales bacterium]